MSAGPATTPDPTRFARRAMGIELTEVQQQAIDSVLGGRDTLLVSPTGSGKSAVYQIAGALLEGVTVIVSPLIALQDDQVASFAELDLGLAVAIHSAAGRAHRAAALRAVRGGEAQFVLIGPEQLQRDDVVDALRSVHIDRFVVDEAHCLDVWGADFRPEFGAVGHVRAELGAPPTLAMTASAAPHVRDEIAAILRMRDAEVIVADPERHNIDLAVRTHPDAAATRDAIVDDAVARDGAGIVYVGRRADAVALAERLVEAGRAAVPYHAGLGAAERRSTLERFTGGEELVVVATNAFGLGIDVPHVRFVLHLDSPESIDAYYQEIGRAGRDGEPADAVVHRTAGRSSSRAFAGAASEVTAELCERIAAGIGRPVDELRSASRVSRGRFLRALRVLEQLGVVRVGDGLVHGGPVGLDAVAAELDAAVATRQAIAVTRQQMMRDFEEAVACRWATVIGYLGGEPLSSCGHCDRCAEHDAGRRTAAPKTLTHRTFGDGEVVSESDDEVVVRFASAGYRRLDRATLEENDLIVEERLTTPA